MSMPMKARSVLKLLTAFAGGGILLAGCAGDATAPSSAVASPTPQAISRFVPSASAKALYGVVDGVYSITFDPSQDNSFNLGPNHLDIPANSVCDLANSGYGVETWNSECTPETNLVTITVTIQGASTDDPRMDFEPAMRFNPTKSVDLYMYVPGATETDASNWKMLYCNALNVCNDESLSDPDLQAYVDRSANVVFRRIKHFSGYLVAE